MRQSVSIIMMQKIIAYHQDDVNDWVAELGCGHCQHVRHNPPWTNRPWVVTESGRADKLGELLDCVKCERLEPMDKPV